MWYVQGRWDDQRTRMDISDCRTSVCFHAAMNGQVQGERAVMSALSQSSVENSELSRLYHLHKIINIEVSGRLNQIFAPTSTQVASSALRSRGSSSAPLRPCTSNTSVDADCWGGHPHPDPHSSSHLHLLRQEIQGASTREAEAN